MKSFQERLLKDFDVKKEPGKDGKVKRVYTYVGDYAVWSLNNEELTRYKRLYTGVGILLLILFIWKSLQRVPLNSGGLSGGSSLLCFIALMILGIGLWLFVRAKKEMYLRDCKQIKDLILWGSILYLIFQMFGFVTGIIYVAANGTDLLSILVLTADLLTAILAFVLFTAQLKVKHLEIPGSRIKESEKTH